MDSPAAFAKRDTVAVGRWHAAESRGPLPDELEDNFIDLT
jgi:hypothetical protein